MLVKWYGVTENSSAESDSSTSHLLSNTKLITFFFLLSIFWPLKWEHCIKRATGSILIPRILIQLPGRVVNMERSVTNESLHYWQKSNLVYFLSPINVSPLIFFSLLHFELHFNLQAASNLLNDRFEFIPSKSTPKLLRDSLGIDWQKASLEQFHEWQDGRWQTLREIKWSL